MTGFASLAGLLLSAFTSATILPGSSEVVLIALLRAGDVPVAALFLTATIGNVAGSVVNWALGRFFLRYQDRRWFPVSPAQIARAEAWFLRYGLWTVLLAWVPVVGDPLTLVAGILRVPLWKFLALVILAKAGRYLAVIIVYQWAI